MSRGKGGNGIFLDDEDCRRGTVSAISRRAGISRQRINADTSFNKIFDKIKLLIKT
jgi:hypothetical protein